MTDYYHGTVYENGEEVITEATVITVDDMEGVIG